MTTTVCTHQNTYPGLDGIYCADCRTTFEDQTRTCQQLLFRQRHKHSFRPMWQADCTLVEYCSCGKLRPASVEAIQIALANCIVVREDYLFAAEQAKPNSKQNFLDGVETLDGQIQWCREQLEVLKADTVEVEVEPESVAKLSDSTDNNTQKAPPMLTSDLAQEETSMLNPNPIVDELTTAVEVVETLTPDEECDRRSLELWVERAFYEAGAALRELRDRKLYRSTHKTFDQYCRDRFGFERRHPYRLIDAAGVVDNLCPNGTQKGLPKNGTQILPTNERQVRPLTPLTPDLQRSCWQTAVEKAGGKVPSGQIVKKVVDSLNEKEKPSCIAPKDFCEVGDVFTLVGLTEEERKYNGCWAIATALNSFTVGVDIYDQTLLVKPNHLKIIDDPEARKQLPVIAKRIRRLRECSLNRTTLAILRELGQQDVITQAAEELLTFLEQQHGIATHSTMTPGALAAALPDMSPAQLTEIIHLAASRGLDDERLKALAKVAKQILNQRHHPNYFQQA